MYLYKLLQKSLQVFPDGLISAELQVAESLGIETHLRGCGVLQHLPTHAHRQVVMDTHLLKDICIQYVSLNCCQIKPFTNCETILN